MKKNMFLKVVLTFALCTSFVCFIRLQLHVAFEKEQNNAVKDTQKSIQTAADIIKGSKNRIRRESIIFPKVNEPYATIFVDRITFKETIFYGDSPAILDKGIGQYEHAGFPGEGKPILTAGHNGIHFKKLRDMQKDDIVEIQTTYGIYQYKITNMEIINAGDFDTNKLNDNKEYLIMYCCYPFDSLSTDLRYFVYANYVSGPQIR